MHEVFARYPDAGRFQFGDSAALSAELIALVRSGRKTATCDALANYEAEGEPLPVVGQHQIVLDHVGAPVLVVRTTSVEQVRFDEVEWDFAKDEGEDSALEGWRANHRAYFERNGGFDPAMILVCERFELVEIL